jgi:hypothetical protein
MILLGAAAILIGSSIFFLGAQITAATTERLTDLVLGLPFEGGETFSPTTDSELRFYAPLWIAYGAALIWTSARLGDRRRWILPLAGLFLAGGVGRVLAWLAGGPPRLPFIILMAVELILPLVIAALAYPSGNRRGK